MSLSVHTFWNISSETSFEGIPLTKLRKWKALRKHSLHWKIAASVLLKLFIHAIKELHAFKVHPNIKRSLFQVFFEMHHHVRLQSSLLVESFVAHVATKWLFSRVNPAMSLQPCGYPESLSTEFTLVFQMPVHRRND